MHKSVFALCLLGLMMMLACGDSATEKTAQANSNKTASIDNLFSLKSVAECGIDFNNEIIENEVYNHILIDVIVHGGGVAVVDVNNDGLQDLFFAGNMVSDRLYLNKGNLKFEDISQSAGIENKTWSTAVAVADVNADGWQDIYVGKFIIDDPKQRRNALYINNKDNTFTESAAQYGIDDDGHCMAANFFDYDQDGDLDLYLGLEPYVLVHAKKLKLNQDDFSNKFFRNDGGVFTDVTEQAGLKNFNFTLSATVGDLNHDGYPDMYVTSDYEEPDHLYINNQDGTFTDRIHTQMKHISNFSMGSDIADFNNDGWPDIVVTDMAPEDNYRSKANMSGMNPKKFWNLANNGYHYQYMFNTLQMNNGNGAYSEIGHQAGIAQTDWSWATLLADYDLDGDKDLLITNGQLRDIRNKDYMKKVSHVIDSLTKKGTASEQMIDAISLIKYAPQEKLTNYLFFNKGDLGFDDKASKVGLEQATFTQGAVYADLDNDGDLDIVMNNMNDRAFVYENHAVEQMQNHYLSIKLKGQSNTNPYVYGAKVWVINGDDVQLQEVNPVRGYMSSVDPVLVFGLGEQQQAERVVVQWPGSKVTELNNVKADQRLTIEQSSGERKAANIYHINPPLFKDFTAQSKITYVHKENKFDDYKDEVLIPHRMSQLGPAAAKADVNGDGLEDVFIGGATAGLAGLYLQQSDQTMLATDNQLWKKEAIYEDIAAHFFDADGDGDPDLYVCSGGNEYMQGSPQLEDRLYINDGKGHFTKSNTIPSIRVSTGVVTSGDIDGDGDLDLFVGGRQLPQQYGYPVQSFLLKNENGRFVDATAQWVDGFEKLGMISDALLADFDGDNDLDLICAGEWTPIKVFLNDQGRFTEHTAASGLAKTNGWWNRLAMADMDNDGDLDIVAGNLGLNIKFKASEDQPFKAYIKDFDENGTNDVYLAYYDTKGLEVPVRGRQCSSEQMPYIVEEFENYDLFAKATLEEVLGDRIQGAVKQEAFLFESVYLENKGDASFSIHKLPAIAQTAPIFGLLLNDWDKDGHTDILLAGNYHQREVETTRSDAGVGQLLLGNGKGGFEPMPTYETGIYAAFDVKNLLSLENQSKPLLLVVNNDEGVQMYK